ncbi:hypothetical protein [Brevibacillus sp. NRS-1366]|uniref:hypothetical protein n=1 Tax=Brevibacillus sp. NRS-1366 TaxID=3233899 RepID=UPI003D25F0EC
MKFTHTASYGDKSLSEILIPSLKEYAKDMYGINVNVSVNPKYTTLEKRKPK